MIHSEREERMGKLLEQLPIEVVEELNEIMQQKIANRLAAEKMREVAEVKTSIALDERALLVAVVLLGVFAAVFWIFHKFMR